MCDAWVCTLWKAAGLFGAAADRFQCTEGTNWDVVALPVFGQVSPRRRLRGFGAAFVPEKVGWAEFLVRV